MIRNPVQLTKRQAEVLQVVTDNPGSNLTQIAGRLNSRSGSIGYVLLRLHEHKLIDRTGVPRLYRYYPTGEPFEIAGAVIRRTAEVIQGPDPYLDHLAAARLTDTQIAFIRANPKMRRSELARRLKMDKPVLVQALIAAGMERR